MISQITLNSWSGFFDLGEKLLQEFECSIFYLIKLHAAQDQCCENQCDNSNEHECCKEWGLSTGLFNKFFIGFSLLFILLQIVTYNFFIFLIELVHKGLLELFLFFLSSLFKYGVVSEFLHLLLLFLLGLLSLFFLLDLPLPVSLDGLLVLSVKREDNQWAD